MKEREKQGNISRSDFLRYRKGEMSEREKNSFERELQKDPFAAEAEEGFSEFPAASSEKDLSHLDRLIKSRSGKRKSFVFYRIAASAAVLMIISTIFLVTRNNYESIKEKETIIAVPATMDIKEAEPIRGEITGDEEKIIAENRQVLSRPGQRIADAINREAISTQAVKAEDTGEKNIVPQTDDHIIVDENKQEDVNAEKQYPTAAQAVTAVYGIRKKSVPDTEEVSLDEVVVTGYGVERQEADGFTPPLPVEGKKSYNDYIAGNIIVPENLKEGERAVVIVSFIVKASGVLDSLKVVRSPGDEFSAEAERLVREGPAWMPGKTDGVPHDDEVRLRIVFKK